MTSADKVDQPLLVEGQQLQSFMDSMPIAMILADRDGRIRAVGKRVETDFGYQPQDLLGQNLNVMMATPTAPRCARLQTVRWR